MDDLGEKRLVAYHPTLNLSTKMWIKRRKWRFFANEVAVCVAFWIPNWNGAIIILGCQELLTLAGCPNAISFENKIIDSVVSQFREFELSLS